MRDDDELPLTPELRRIFDSVPPEMPKSRLDPYRSLILLWRRQGRSFAAVRRLVEEKLGVKVSESMIKKFVRSRSRPRKTEPPVVVEAPAQVEAHVEIRKPLRKSPAEIAAIREAASAATHRPAFPAPEEPTRFEYDPTRPLTNRKPD